MRLLSKIQVNYPNIYNVFIIIAPIFGFISAVIIGLIFVTILARSFYLIIENRYYSDWLTGYMTFCLVIATIFLAITTAFVIWWQGRQLKKQLELQIITELYKEWNEDRMFRARCALCKILPSDGVICKYEDNTLDKVESVIEFLERIASYYMNGVLTRSLVWDTFSFYIMRYYFYTHNAIKEIEKKWGDDKTLYCDLNNLYKALMKLEVKRRVKTKEEIEHCFKEETEKFRKAECYENPQNIN
jgi:branched-subunit amino acid transport protein